MKDWFYQIKGKAGEGNDSGLFGGVANWVFPPIFSGKVTAEDKKKAKEMVEEEYNHVFPLRVLKKDLDSNEFLLNIREITDNKTKELFKDISCKRCGTTFKIIDSYNNTHSDYKGSEYCSDECKQDAYEVRRYESDFERDINGIHNPVIYKITNKSTNMCYVGKTTQVFTLRWYQHFFHGTGTKFHDAIKESPITDWTFEVLESIIIEKDLFKTRDEVEQYVLGRESHYISELNCIENGYNSRK
jgi:hypothetical protein